MDLSEVQRGGGTLRWRSPNGHPGGLYAAATPPSSQKGASRKHTAPSRSRQPGRAARWRAGVRTLRTCRSRRGARRNVARERGRPRACASQRPCGRRQVCGRATRGQAPAGAAGVAVDASALPTGRLGQQGRPGGRGAGGTASAGSPRRGVRTGVRVG